MTRRRWEQHDDDAEIAAVLLEQRGKRTGWRNTRLVTDDVAASVEAWAEREADAGRRCSILYADDLASLGA